MKPDVEQLPSYALLARTFLVFFNPNNISLNTIMKLSRKKYFEGQLGYNLEKFIENVILTPLSTLDDFFSMYKSFIKILLFKYKYLLLLDIVLSINNLM